MRSWTVCKLVVVCMAALGTLAVGVGAASAGTYENLCPSLGEPLFCGHFEWTYMVAVNNSTGSAKGDVYTAALGFAATSSGTSVVRRFGPLGEAKPFAHTGGDISGNELTFPGVEVGVVGVAVDSAGNFYVDPREADKVDEFNSEGEAVGTPISLPAGTAATGIAIDNTAGPSKGDIYVASENTGTILKYKPNGEPDGHSTVEEEHPLTPYSLAVDSSGHVYAANQHSGGKVQKFSESLVLEGEVGEPESRAVAVDPLNRRHIHRVCRRFG